MVDFPPSAARPAAWGLGTTVNYALQQNLIPPKIDVTELFDGLTRALRPQLIGPDRAIGSRQFSL
jgi:hypothetical protein